MESRSRASPEQFAVLLEFMESRGDISRPHPGLQGRIRSDRLWQELGELVNSVGGGITKPVNKWKKVWADWKTKTKKKSLAIRREASGTGGGPSSRQVLTAFEHRVLGIMGLSAVVGQAGIEERGFDGLPSEAVTVTPNINGLPSEAVTVTPNINGLPSEAVTVTPNIRDTELDLQISGSTDEIIFDFFPSHSIEGTRVSAAPSLSLPPPSGELPPQPQVSTSPPVPAPVPVPSVTSPTTLQGASRRRPRVATPSPLASPTASTPRRRTLLRTRRRRLQTPFERATSEFVAIEERRLPHEEVRERNHHARELERLRLESRRISTEENQNQILVRLADIAANLLEMLPQLRPSSLPSTDILP